jgi:hypothetical protein
MNSKHFVTTRRDSLLLLALSIIVLLVVSLILQLPANCLQEWYYYPDARSYREAAEQLYRHNGAANSIRPFGYPILIGLPYLSGVATDKMIVVFAICLNVVAWVATIQIIFRISGWLSGRLFAWIASLLFLLSFSHIISLYQSLSETIFLLLVLVSLWTFIRFWQSGRDIFLVFALIALCYSVTVRPVTYYFAIIATIISFVYLVRCAKLRIAVAVLFVFLVTIGIQMGNMYRCYGKFTISFIQNYTMHMYVLAVAESMQSGTDLVTVQQRKIDYADSLLRPWAPGSREFVVNADAIYAKTVAQNLSSNRKNVLRAVWQNIVMNSSDGNLAIATLRNCEKSTRFVVWQRVFANVTRWQNKLFSMFCVAGMAGVALVVLRKRKIDGPILMMCFMNAIVAYLLLTSGISFWQGDRFNAVLYPFTFINLCWLASSVYSMWARRQIGKPPESYVTKK